MATHKFESFVAEIFRAHYSRRRKHGEGIIPVVAAKRVSLYEILTI